MLTFWKSSYRSSIHIQGVEVHTFSQADGQAELTFPTHALYLLESDAATVHAIGDMDLTHAEYQRSTLFFIPKETPLICRPVEPFDITTMVIPEQWFRCALRGRANYDDLKPLPFETHSDRVLVSAVFLLKHLALDPPTELPPENVADLILSLASRVMRSACDIQPSEHALTPGDMKAMTDHIEANLERRIQLDELADVANLSRFHFSREFKAATNVTPMQYVLERRIAAAKVLLRDTRRSLADIALDCGFASQSHFTTSFRQSTGVTPSAWRTSSGKG